MVRDCIQTGACVRCLWGCTAKETKLIKTDSTYLILRSVTKQCNFNQYLLKIVYNISPLVADCNAFKTFFKYSAMGHMIS